MKILKTPPLSSSTKLLCFDLESNGLHGEVFAIGTVVMDAAGKIYDEFSGQSEIDGPVDDWVQANVLPAIRDMQVTHKTYRDLREAFWTWYLQAEPKADYVLVSNGYPVEYRFLLKCQDENIDERYWQHPFPILDLSSLMIQVGRETSNKNQIVSDILRGGDFRRHHPLDDAKITALAAFEAFRQAGRI